MEQRIAKYLKNHQIQEFTPGYSDSKTYCIDNRWFLKVDKKGELLSEYLSLKLFSNNGIAPEPLRYLSLDKDYLFIEKIPEQTAFDSMFGANLISFMANSLRDFHERDFSLSCLTVTEQKLFHEKTRSILEYIRQNYSEKSYNRWMFDCFHERSIDDIFKYISDNELDLETDVMIHGDFNARNVFCTPDGAYKVIDTGEAGFTDRHIDIAFAIFALKKQTKEENVEAKFLDAYGSDKINEKRLKLCKKLSVLYYF